METIYQFLTGDGLGHLVRAVAVFVLGFFLARLITATVDRFVGPRVPSHRLLLRRAVWYGLMFLIVATTLRQVGFDLSVLLGAAGILTVAVGFASQTSASNLISGIFLLTERPFTVGDVIQANGTTGEVISIDLISVKLRTFDNVLVRLPNEMLLKSQITNLTAFPIRRFDLTLPVAFESDVEAVKRLLLGLAAQHPLVLDEPAPAFGIKSFGSAGVPTALEIQLSVWGAAATFSAMRDGLQAEIHQALAAGGLPVRWPVPQDPTKEVA